MSDLIDRQAAIEALIKWYGCEPSDIGAFENIIEKLPSAQPEIIRCKDCKWKQGAECTRFAEVRPFPDDFCSRGERM